ncbi:pseudouridine synthase [Jeotgalibacillus soli]|uniref:Pseudouridine synthase n=1 Tax=Jeotgalibacillus soli TaxID=889306 RepID=A0A0C2RH47_9BACL|nr:pseudouridine synthase [Jeotgalibacillus soli]KIL49485.1 RNA pseudouridine synthase [Jeotgalibacillus soli]
MHIHTYISKTGYCSRRETIRLLKAERITVNGEICASNQQVDEGDDVRIDGHPLPIIKKFVYLILNKPRGIICTSQQNIENNIIDFVGYPERIFAIGRLDKESEGLILLSNDGSIVNPLMKTEHAKEKEYVVTVDRPVTDQLIEGIREGGIDIKGKKTSPCTVEQLSETAFRIILTQGLNRQIRRMCRTFGFTVQSLKRVRIMDIYLNDLPIGKWRHLSDAEVKQLKR